jgi:type IV pilus assembly protein PilC
MLYHYLAADKTGTLIEGEREAETVADIVRFLASSGYQPVAVEKIGKETGIQLFQGHINAQDKVFLVKYLALMMKVGTDLLSAINILIADFEKRAVKDFLLEVREGLSQGHPFYEAFARHTEIFSPVFVNLIKAAETSGNLEQTFEELAESLERDAEILSKAKSAMIYPAILMVAGLGLFTFLSTFAIPKIAKVFLDSGIEPPFISRIVFGAGLLVNDHLILFILSIIGGVFGFWYLFFKNRLGRVVRDRVVRRLPLVSAVVRDLAVQRFTGTLSSLLRAGLPIVEIEL